MRSILILFILLPMVSISQPSEQNENSTTTNLEFKTPFEKNNNSTATYFEAIEFYKNLAHQFETLELKEYGATDSGHPLHLAVLSSNGEFEPQSIRKSGKQILMINNAIHPGEPCGVDASMLLLKDYLTKPELQKYLENLVIIVIPIYNIGGALNRNSTTRANQNGPESYGFRGNAQNLDLNRDFIKCDSKNAQTFNQIFTEWQPDVFVDNHTSNGADYQYTLTLIPTQHNKLDPNLAAYLYDEMLPKLYKGMAKTDYEMTPYVYARSTPDEGIAEFLDLPRYSSGYAALLNTISFMPETHMLKPFKSRVESVHFFMDCMIKTMHDDHKKIKTARHKAIEETKAKHSFDLNWELDFTKSTKITFKGYEAKYKTSEITGLDRLYYDRNAPYEKEIPFYNEYKTTLSVERPEAYIVPQSNHRVIERLNWNGVEMKRLAKDTEIEVELYQIGNFETTDYAYEGHYLHSDLKVEKKMQTWLFRKGDYVIYTNQKSNRYIIETLEPQAPDAYFSWNFFDGILMQKEYFSSYVFEDLAAEYLKQNPELKEQLEKKKKEDDKFASSTRAQLNFIYQNSPWHEKTHRVYPVGRLIQKIDLPVE